MYVSNLRRGIGISPPVAWREGGGGGGVLFGTRLFDTSEMYLYISNFRNVMVNRLNYHVRG